MRLHAVLGQSLIPLANAILCNAWTDVILYSQESNKTNSIVNRIRKLHKSLEITSTFPNIDMVTIPSLDERNSISEMLMGVQEVLTSRLKADSEDILFYSATVPHLIQFIKLLGIQSLLVIEGTQLKIKGLNDESWEMLSLNVDQFLNLHGLNDLNDYKNLENASIGENGKIQLSWTKPKSNSDRKRLVEKIFLLRGYLGNHAMEHHVADDSIQMWLKNMDLPYESEEEE